MEISEKIGTYLTGRDLQKSIPPDEPRITVNEAVGAVAFYYEKLRNVVDYQDEHLIRQNAIRRIIKRRLIVQDSYEDVALSLLKELVRSRYFPNGTISYGKVQEVSHILALYIGVVDALASDTNFSDRDKDTLIAYAACAIDENLASMAQEEALVKLMYDTCEAELVPTDLDTDEKIRKTQIFVACYRVLLRPDAERLRYFLLKQMYSVCTRAAEADPKDFAKNFFSVQKKIQDIIRHPHNKKLLPFLRRYRIPFILLHTIVRSKSKSILEDPDELEKQIQKLCEQLYASQRKRLYGRSIRAFVYIFLTKMLLGIGVELPYDLFTIRHINSLPLIVNIAFPPILLLCMTLSAKLPGAENTTRILQAVKEIVYADEPRIVFTAQRLPTKKKRIVLPIIFTFLYLVLFAVSFGAIAWALRSLQFNIVSGVIFFLFLSLVTFFGVSIRRSVQEYVMIVKKPNVLMAFLDPFFLPIIQMGRWLSFNISRINVFVFIFDVLIELPFQALIDITEEWFIFIREKKEEME
ncbi:hypothetical protein HYW94_04505 [Candidatus Uhrbacteria bacterium]|nr:hypothetical protein [Candidatus Uhrbacteria bacterium]